MVLEGNGLDIGLTIRPVIVQANSVIRQYKRGSLSLITPRIERSVNIFRPFNQKLRQLLLFYHWKEEVSKMYKEKKQLCSIQHKQVRHKNEGTGWKGTVDTKHTVVIVVMVCNYNRKSERQLTPTVNNKQLNVTF